MTIGLGNRALLALAVAGVTAAVGAQETAAPVHVSELRSVPAETTAAAYVDKSWRPPRTSWGHPSLEGAWSTDGGRHTRDCQSEQRPVSESDGHAGTPLSGRLG